MAETGTISVNPSKYEGGDWNPLTLDPNTLIEGRRVEELALAVHGPEAGDAVLSYEDILTAFGLKEDQYTHDHHENLLARALVYGEASLEDSLPPPFSHRSFLNLFWVSPGALCQLQKKGYPDTDPAFRLFLGNRAKANAQQARTGEKHFLLAYAYRQGAVFLNFVQEHMRDPGFGNQVMSFLVDDFTRAVFVDVDPKRVGRISRFFTERGCPPPAKLRPCVIMADRLAEQVFSDPQCPTFQADLTCYSGVFGNLISSLTQTDTQNLSGYQQANKSNTFTSLERAVHVRDVLAKLSNLAKPPQRILIVGPGLEVVDPLLSDQVPMQSYEPFAVAEGGLALGASLEGLQVDLVDISPDVVGHWQGIRKSATEGKPHRLHLVLSGNQVTRDEVDLPSDLGYGLSATKTVDETQGAVKGQPMLHKVIEISPAVSRVFHPWEGDIITDRFAPEASYDLVVMLNVFMYLDNEEKILALENIRRMLVPGGVLVTDLGVAHDRGIEPTEGCPVTGGEGFTKVVLTESEDPMPMIAFVKQRGVRYP